MQANRSVKDELDKALRLDQYDTLRQDRRSYPVPRLAFIEKNGRRRSFPYGVLEETDGDDGRITLTYINTVIVIQGRNLGSILIAIEDCTQRLIEAEDEARAIERHRKLQIAQNDMTYVTHIEITPRPEST